MPTREKVDDLFKEYGIRESDIEETFIKSQGPGGQNINKVASCVCLRHYPTGIYIKCQTQRTQAQNRLQARWLLISKIIASQENERTRKAKEKFLRWVKDKRRTKSLKEEILKQKKRASQKKRIRAKTRPHAFDE